MPKSEARVVEIGDHTAEIDPVMLYVTKDVSEEMNGSASVIAYYAEQHGRAKAEVGRLTGEYRHWRGRMLVASANEGLAEWKARANFEAHPKFKRFKDRIAAAEGLVVEFDGLVRAAIARSTTLQSIGANLRAEYGATGQTTKTHDTTSKANTARRAIKSRKKREKE